MPTMAFQNFGLSAFKTASNPRARERTVNPTKGGNVISLKSARSRYFLFVRIPSLLETKHVSAG